MRLRRYIMTAALAAAACGESTGVEVEYGASVLDAPAEVTLRIGQEAQIAGSVLGVSFVSVVEDSRCPIDVICVWEGNAVVEVGLRLGMGPTIPVQLNTHIDPRPASWDGVRLLVLELQPAPRASVPIEPGDYVLKLRLEPR